MNYERPDNPLYSGMPLRHEGAWPVLGVPVRLATNAAAVLAAADTSFGGWRVLDAHPELVAGADVTVRVIVHDVAGAALPVTYRRPDPGLMMFLGAGAFGYADAVHRSATAFVPPALVAAPEQFRHAVLEAMVLFLLTGPSRYPVHASAIARGGRALLLAGASGSGKSTLAWVMGRAGWDVLSDDVCYVQAEPSWRVWGGVGARSYLAPDVAAFFPELATAVPAIVANGRHKLALARAVPSPPVCAVAGLVLLEPGGAAAELRAIPAAEALAALTGNLELGFDAFADAAAVSLPPLARRAWRLRTGPDPRAVPALLEQAFEVL